MHPDTKKYDEDKCFLGFKNAKAAKKAFDENYDRPERFFDGMTVMTMNKFKQNVLAKENHGEKLDMQSGELGYFVSSFHIDMIPNTAPKLGKSVVPDVDQDAFNTRMIQLKYPQPLYIERTAVEPPTGSTTPYPFAQVYANRKDK